MKLWVVAVGNKMPSWIDTGFREYAKRIPSELGLNLIEIKPEKRGRTKLSAKTKTQLLANEEKRILAVIPQRCLKVLLDEHGKTYATLPFSQQLAQWIKDGRDIAFIIGGADGVARELKQSADMLLALSAMTFPHGLARILLVEQLYRALSYSNGHPYHRE